MFFSNDNDKKEFLKSALGSHGEIIDHYTFVIDDISSEISNPELEASKASTLAFLKEMRTLWVRSRDSVQQQLDRLNQS